MRTCFLSKSDKRVKHKYSYDDKTIVLIPNIFFSTEMVEGWELWFGETYTWICMLGLMDDLGKMNMLLGVDIVLELDVLFVIRLGYGSVALMNWLLAVLASSICLILLWVLGCLVGVSG